MTEIPWELRASVSQEEACKLLGLSRPLMVELRRRGEIQAKVLDRRVLIPVSEIKRFLGMAS